MLPDDELCMCFHVSWRKVINYIRIHKVRVASRLSECQGAGTGCGWCRVFMEQLVERIQVDQPAPEDLEQWLADQMPAAQAYARRRAGYIARGQVRSSEDEL
ncbi:MAG: (2Fe-2S)-binding protein [Pirellulaceae bacterium]|nr:(2Fe-2S)-binding protein [Pirellulaceae bacterium]